MQRDATQLLGADLVLSSDSPVGAPLRERATAGGLVAAETVTFPSMAVSDKRSDDATLSAVKAVSPGYPLRGTLRLKSALDAPDVAAPGVPPRGAVWVDGQLLAALRR